MKLYNETETERASKGQGGNKWLRMSVTCGSEERAEVFRLAIEATGTGKGKYDRTISHVSGERTFLLQLAEKLAEELEKGNKQKAEKYYRCPHGMPEKHLCVFCSKE